jgi:hypothetical protein
MTWPKKKASVRRKPEAPPPMLPFLRADWAEVGVGARVATFRLVKQAYYPRRGQVFHARAGHQALPGRFRCDDIRRMTLGKARLRYWQELGAAAPEKVETLWTELFGREAFDDTREGFLYLATRVG